MERVSKEKELKVLNELKGIMKDVVNLAWL
jgi:hypothetical protein